jgi:hypothetical protein
MGYLFLNMLLHFIDPITYFEQTKTKQEINKNYGYILETGVGTLRANFMIQCVITLGYSG